MKQRTRDAEDGSVVELPRNGFLHLTMIRLIVDAGCSFVEDEYLALLDEGTGEGGPGRLPHGVQVARRRSRGALKCPACYLAWLVT